jgi:hypothetical protein
MKPKETKFFRLRGLIGYGLFFFLNRKGFTSELYGRRQEQVKQKFPKFYRVLPVPDGSGRPVHHSAKKSPGLDFYHL